MERVRKAKWSTGRQRIACVQSKDDDPEHIQDNGDLNSDSRGYCGDESSQAEGKAYKGLQEWAVGWIQPGVPDSLRQSETIQPGTH